MQRKCFEISAIKKQIKSKVQTVEQKKSSSCQRPQWYIDIAVGPDGVFNDICVMQYTLGYFVVIMKNQTSVNDHQGSSHSYSVTLLWQMWSLSTASKSEHLLQIWLILIPLFYCIYYFMVPYYLKTNKKPTDRLVFVHIAYSAATGLDFFRWRCFSG